MNVLASYLGFHQVHSSMWPRTRLRISPPTATQCESSGQHVQRTYMLHSCLLLTNPFALWPRGSPDAPTPPPDRARRNHDDPIARAAPRPTRLPPPTTRTLRPPPPSPTITPPPPPSQTRTLRRQGHPLGCASRARENDRKADQRGSGMPCSRDRAVDRDRPRTSPPALQPPITKTEKPKRSRSQLAALASPVNGRHHSLREWLRM